MARQEKNEILLAIARSMENIPWCEDYERMVSGMLYNAWVVPLATARFRARRLCHNYNTHFPLYATFESLTADRFTILEELCGKVGEGCFIEPPFNVDYGCNIRMGKRVYANFGLTILDCGLVTVGNRTMFGPNVSIYAATHETEVSSRRDDIEYAREVTIGNDCWIGGNAMFMPGVRIGNGVTVGAGSVVTRDVPDFCVVMGSPARVVKRVTPVESLEEDGEVV